MYDQIYNTSNEVVKSLKADKNYSFLIKARILGYYINENNTLHSLLSSN